MFHLKNEVNSLYPTPGIWGGLVLKVKIFRKNIVKIKHSTKSTESITFKQGVATGQRISRNVPSPVIPQPDGRPTPRARTPTWPSSQDHIEEDGLWLLAFLLTGSLHLSKKRNEAGWTALSGGMGGPTQNPRAEVWASVGVRVRGWGTSQTHQVSMGRELEEKPTQRRSGTLLIWAHLLPVAPKAQQDHSSQGHRASEFAQLPKNSHCPLKLGGTSTEVTPKRGSFSKSSEPLHTGFSQGSSKSCIKLLSFQS